MDPVILKLVEEAKELSPKSRDASESWAAFLRALHESQFDSNEPKYSQGDPGSLTRFISIEYADRGVVRLDKIWTLWDDAYRREAAKQVLLEYMASTVEVVYYSKGVKAGKPERLPKDEVAKPWKPGHLLLEENARIEGRGFDRDEGPTFVLRSTPIGTETPSGTVVGKRKVGGKVQYLVKPRGAAAEKKYLAREELEELRTRLRVNLDLMGLEDIAKTRKRIEELEKRV